MIPLALLVLASSLAAPPEIGQPLPQFSAEALDTRTVDSRGLRGKVVLLGVATDGTSSALVDWQVRLGYQATTQLGGAGRVVVVSIADMRDFSWVVRPFARGRLRTLDRDARRRLRGLFAADGVDAPPELDSGVFLVPDWSGQLASALVPASSRGHPSMFIVDGDGVIRGIYAENTPSTRDQAMRLIGDVLASTPGGAR